MSNHLLAVAVGPVQEFIAAARRTRDMWFGSHLLSEISRAVAEEVSKHGELIFPASADAPNVANIILAELRPGTDAASVAADASKAAKNQWRAGYADGVFGEFKSVIRPDIWGEQVDDVIEFYAAWTPLVGDYRDARAKVMRLLAGRKNCRDFSAAKGRAGVPKSSLDGLRESVLKNPAEEPWPDWVRARLRVRDGEQLDVVGLVKRGAGGTRAYPSVSRIAADPWIRGREGQLDEVIAECQRLGPDIIHRLDVSANGHPHYAPFPYEGSAVFRNRHHELVEEARLGPDALHPLASAVSRLGEPNPYLAVVVADGDRMGETLARLRDAETHRAFSATLAEFAQRARNIVQKHHGVLVYAGGDDVLAFLPVDQCLHCGRELHDTFGRTLEKWGTEAGANITLSVGVGIGHFLENLEDLRECGRAAEQHAKRPDRDGLAVHLHKRGGGPIKVRGRWTDRLDERLAQFAGWLNDRKIPSRLATDLNRMADVYEKWQNDPATAIRQDVLRTIRAKQPAGVSVLPAIEADLRARVIDAASLRQLAEELLIARQIATACRQAAGHQGAEDE